MTQFGNAVGNTGWAQTGQVAQTNGGGYYSVLDMKRSAQSAGRTPWAEHPDGYLGESRSRRSDRLLDNVQSRLTQRSYQRGVHKGDRIDPQDYYWAQDVMTPQSGIEAQMLGTRWTAMGETPENIINHMGKNHLLTPQQLANVANGLGIADTSRNDVIDPIRSARMQRLLPGYK